MSHQLLHILLLMAASPFLIDISFQVAWRKEASYPVINPNIYTFAFF